MDCAERVQMPGLGTARGLAGAQMPITPPRTFDGIADAVGRVRASRQQVEGMLNRISPTPRDIEAKNAALLNQLGHPPYANSLEQLHGELNELGIALDQLEKHV